MEDEGKIEDGQNIDNGGDKGEQSGDGQQHPQIDPEIASRAALYGWVPKEEFRGDLSKWVSADVFVKRADEVLPIARSMNRKLESDLATTRKELEETRKTVKAVIQAHKKTAQGSYESRVAQIEKEQIEAVSAADSEQWARLEGEKKALQKPEDIPFEDKGGGTIEHPTVTQWKQDNAWYINDMELHSYADAVSNFIASTTPNLPPETFLSKVKDEVQKRFPEKFGNVRRRNPPSVDRSDFGGNDDTGGKKTYSDLPPDAKKACTELVAQKVLTREQYVQTYFEG